MKKERKKLTPNWKRKSLTVIFADDMILCKHPKDSTRKLLGLISEFSNIEGYKINTQNSVAFLYTNNESSEREIQETIYHYNK